jgi:hypothetical protein
MKKNTVGGMISRSSCLDRATILLMGKPLSYPGNGDGRQSVYERSSVGDPLGRPTGPFSLDGGKSTHVVKRIPPSIQMREALAQELQAEFAGHPLEHQRNTERSALVRLSKPAEGG